jgi:osomolarity two-component system response regulator SSK1
MKNLNYMSRNLEEFGLDSDETISEAGEEEREGETEPSLRPKDTFDIGETLQSAGDVLSGVAAQAGVDLVLFHGDVSLKHVSVIGDECGLAFALSHVRFSLPFL